MDARRKTSLFFIVSIVKFHFFPARSFVAELPAAMLTAKAIRNNMAEVTRILKIGCVC
jgi:hypothetical protein